MISQVEVENEQKTALEKGSETASSSANSSSNPQQTFFSSIVFFVTSELFSLLMLTMGFFLILFHMLALYESMVEVYMHSPKIAILKKILIGSIAINAAVYAVSCFGRMVKNLSALPVETKILSFFTRTLIGVIGCVLYYLLLISNIRQLSVINLNYLLIFIYLLTGGIILKEIIEIATGTYKRLFRPQEIPKTSPMLTSKPDSNWFFLLYALTFGFLQIFVFAGLFILCWDILYHAKIDHCDIQIAEKALGKAHSLLTAFV